MHKLYTVMCRLAGNSDGVPLLRQITPNRRQKIRQIQLKRGGADIWGRKRDNVIDKWANRAFEIRAPISVARTLICVAAWRQINSLISSILNGSHVKLVPTRPFEWLSSRVTPGFGPRRAKR